MTVNKSAICRFLRPRIRIVIAKNPQLFKFLAHFNKKRDP